MNVLVLFSYGSLTSIDDVAGFYQDIYHGTATDADVARGYKLYDSFGKADPLGANMTRIGKTLATRLQRVTGEEWKMYIANKHTDPSLEDVAEECIILNPKRIVTYSLTPFDTLTGSTAYEKKFTNAFRKHNTETEIIHIPPFSENESFINALSDRVNTAYHWLPESTQNKAEIIFTVHSMPGVPKAHQKMISQYQTLAKKVAENAGVKKYHLAYRSGKPLPKRWLGPDVLDVVRDLYAQGVPSVIFVEALSVIENLEAIQEITIEAVGKAQKLGMHAVQSEFLNDSVDFVEALIEHMLDFQDLQLTAAPPSIN